MGAVNLVTSHVEVVDTESHSRQVFRNSANNMKALSTAFVNALRLVVHLADIKDQWLVRNVLIEFIEREVPSDTTTVKISEQAKLTNMVEMVMITILS